MSGEQHLPEPEGFVAKHLIGCLRKWYADYKGMPMILTDKDIGCLEEQADQLYKAWLQADSALKRSEINVVQDSVQIKPDLGPKKLC